MAKATPSEILQSLKVPDDVILEIALAPIQEAVSLLRAQPKFHHLTLEDAYTAVRRLKEELNP